MGLVPAYATKMASERHQHQLVELALSARAQAIGHRISELPLPDSPYQLMLVGVSRNGGAPREPLADLRLEAGDAAVVDYTLKSKGRFRGREIDDTTRVMRVFVKRNGRWQCVAAQYTLVARP